MNTVSSCVAEKKRREKKVTQKMGEREEKSKIRCQLVREHQPLADH